VAAFCVFVAAALALLDLLHSTTGEDLRPYVEAGRLVLRGEGDLYANPYFVYLPTAALLFAPLAGLGREVLFYAIGAAELLAIGAGAALTLRLLAVRRWVEWGCLLAVGMVTGHKVWFAIAALNVHAFLLPALVLVCGLWARQRWEAGALVLVATAVLKPMLAPLLLLPLAHGQVRALLRPALVLLAAVAGAAAVVPGGWGVVHLPGYVADGIGMHGDLEGWNLALTVHLDRLGVPGPVVVACRVFAALAALSVLRASADSAPDLLLAATALLAASFLAGSLSEVSYALLLLPGLVVALHRARGTALVLLGTAAALLVVPLPEVGLVLFTTVLAEALLLAGLVALRPLPAPERTALRPRRG